MAGGSESGAQMVRRPLAHRLKVFARVAVVHQNMCICATTSAGHGDGCSQQQPAAAWRTSFANVHCERARDARCILHLPETVELNTLGYSAIVSALRARRAFAERVAHICTNVGLG